MDEQTQREATIRDQLTIAARVAALEAAKEPSR